MARHRFQLGVKHPARLSAVWLKPLENERTHLLRFEFEIFREMNGGLLKSTGKIACRDIAINSSSNVGADRGVRRYAQALKVGRPERLEDWLGLTDRQPWVHIGFGPRDSRDQRNSFDEISPFDHTNYRVIDFPYDLSLEWVTAGQAARQLSISPSTVRRIVRRFEPMHGGELVRRTEGGHRRINLALLRNLLPAK